MRRTRFLALTLVAVLALTLSGAYNNLASAQPSTRYFNETGHNVSGKFLDYWNKHGGLSQQGYPISEEMSEVSDVNGKAYTVQYFERAVFEYHPENKSPYDVLLTPLGSLRLKNYYSSGNPTPEAAAGSAGYFPQTKHSVTGRFLQYWQEHGGLTQQGYPITEEFTEKSDLDGNTYQVQYFERAVFELHPENQPPNDVLLSQLGTFRYGSKYGPVSRVDPVGGAGGNPPANNPAPTNPPAPTNIPAPTNTPPAPTPQPQPTTPPAPPSQPTTPPAPPSNDSRVDVIDYTHYIDSIGSLWFVGVIRNNSGVAAGSIKVSLILFDSSNGVVGTGDDPTLDDVKLNPGQNVGFSILVDSPPQQWAREEVKVDASPYDPSNYYYTYADNLSSSGSTMAPSDLEGEVVRGIVNNNGDTDAEFVQVIVTCYDNSDKVADVDNDYVDGTNGEIPAGGSSTFEVNLLRSDTTYARCELLVFGREK